MTTPDSVAYWLARLAAAERSADYARQQLAAARAPVAPTGVGNSSRVPESTNTPQGPQDGTQGRTGALSGNREDA